MKKYLKFAFLTILSAVLVIGLSIGDGIAGNGNGNNGNGRGNWSGNNGNHGNGPPAHAPAVGYRAKQFMYYPTVNVYFDPVAAVYYCLVDGVWQMLNVLPDSVQVQLGDSVTLEVDTELPYTNNAAHLQQYLP